MTDTAPRRRTGGRAARQARPRRGPRRARPVPDPDADALRGARRGGPGAHRAERRHDPRGGRPRVPRRSRGPPAVRDAGADVAGRARALPARACAARSSRRRRRANSPSTRATRRATSTSAACTRSSRPNYGSPFVRDLDNGRRYGTHRGLPQLREARLHGALPAPLGRHGLRAGRRAGQQAPPRHGLCHIRYSDKPFMGSVTAPERARDTVEMARILFGAEYLEDAHGDPLAHQRQLAAGLGRDDARGARASTPRPTRRRSSRRSSWPARCRR